MSNLIESKRQNIKQEDAPDVFTLMMKASEGEGNLALNDTELVTSQSPLDRSFV